MIKIIEDYELLGGLYPKTQHKKIARFLDGLWSEKQRYYHSKHHFFKLVELITINTSGNNQRKLLQLALFHDAYYRPGCTNNEANSAKLVKNDNQLSSAILETQWLEAPKLTLTKEFLEFDFWTLTTVPTLAERLATECNIFKEYQVNGAIKVKKED